MRISRLPLIRGVSIGVFGLLSISACSKDPLVQVEALTGAQAHYVTVNAQFCTATPPVVQQKIKYLFIIDRSSSNQPGFPLVPGDVTATDPTGSRRFGPMMQFVQNLLPDPNNLTSFAMIDFSDNAWNPALGPQCDFAGVTPPCTGGFITDSNTFINGGVYNGNTMLGMVNDWIGTGTALNPAPADGGFTDYVLALQAAYMLIQSDAALESGNPIKPIVKSIYNIVFVSDGVPTVNDPTTPGSTCTEAFDTPVAGSCAKTILPEIQNILGLKTDPVLGPYINSISLNTAYYFQNTQLPAAEQLLQDIANAGNGQYMVYGGGQDIVYQVFAPPIRQLRAQFQDLFVENANVVWWDDGQLYQDTDGDGLPDAIEYANGSNPFVADSDGNGVSDLVEYRTTGHPCQDAACAPANRNPYSICAGFGQRLQADGSVVFADTDGDGLNDCEEFILKSDRTTFDSNGDFIPDLMEFKANLPFIAGMNASQAQPMGDGMTNYAKLKAGLPIAIPANQVLNFKPRSTTLVRDMTLPANDTQDCYDATITNVAAMGPGNTIRISVVQSTSVVEDNPILLKAERALGEDASQISFAPGDFK